MMNFDRDRLIHVREILDIKYEKLNEFERSLELVDGVSQKIDLKQKIRRDLLPSIREYEQEYASLLCELPTIEGLEENDAALPIASFQRDLVVIRNLPQIQNEPGLVEKLDRLEESLAKPGTPVSGKLKLLIPVIPLLLQYEIELDTENTLRRTWRALVNVFERGSGQQ